MKLVDLALDDKCVARVVPALKATDDIRPFAQPVDDFAFAFVTDRDKTLQYEHDDVLLGTILLSGLAAG